MFAKLQVSMISCSTFSSFFNVSKMFLFQYARRAFLKLWGSQTLFRIWRKPWTIFLPSKHPHWQKYLYFIPEYLYWHTEIHPWSPIMNSHELESSESLVKTQIAGPSAQHARFSRSKVDSRIYKERNTQRILMLLVWEPYFGNHYLKIQSIWP